MGLSLKSDIKEIKDDDELKDLLDHYRRGLKCVANIGLKREVHSLLRAIELVELKIEGE